MIAQAGFVLWSVLVLLGILSEFIFAQAKWLQLDLRRQNFHRIHHMREMQLEKMAVQFAWQLIPAPLEQTHSFEDDRVMGMRLKQQGQHYAPYYRYRLSDLGQYACAQDLSGHCYHWVLTMMDTRMPDQMIWIHRTTQRPVLSWRWITIHP